MDQRVPGSVVEMTKEPDGKAWNMGVRNPIARWDGRCEHRVIDVGHSSCQLIVTGFQFFR